MRQMNLNLLKAKDFIVQSVAAIFVQLSNHPNTISLTLGMCFYDHNSLTILSSKIIPHPEKVKKGGEDAMFANKKYYLVNNRTWS